MSLADRSKREVLDRLRLTEGQLGLAVQRIAELEAKLVQKDAMISALCARFDDDEEAIDEMLRNPLPAKSPDVQPLEPEGCG